MKCPDLSFLVIRLKMVFMNLKGGVRTTLVSHVSELLFWKLAVVSTVMVVTEHLHSGLKETTISITDS